MLLNFEFSTQLETKALVHIAVGRYVGFGATATAVPSG